MGQPESKHQQEARQNRAQAAQRAYGNVPRTKQQRQHQTLDDHKAENKVEQPHSKTEAGHALMRFSVLGPCNIRIKAWDNITWYGMARLSPVMPNSLSPIVHSILPIPPEHFMLTLHHLETSRSQRILWLLEELGVPYELKRYARDSKTRLAPAALKAIHPLGKSPVITDGDQVIAESGAIIEYLCEVYGTQTNNPDLKHLIPAPGTAEHRQSRFWMHYAEGSLMNWLVMKLIFSLIPTQPMPFIVKPIAKAICGNVIARVIEPNLQAALPFMDKHLEQHTWFAGEHLSMADFQMSFAIEAALVRTANAKDYPHLVAYKERINARVAYKEGIKKGGPVVMANPS